MPKSKPQHGSARGPNKKENSMQYRKYYRCIEETISDLILDMEESSRNLRQDNSKNVITFQQANSNHQAMNQQKLETHS